MRYGRFIPRRGEKEGGKRKQRENAVFGPRSAPQWVNLERIEFLLVSFRCWMNPASLSKT